MFYKCARPPTTYKIARRLGTTIGGIGENGPKLPEGCAGTTGGTRRKELAPNSGPSSHLGSMPTRFIPYGPLRTSLGAVFSWP